MWAPYSEPLKVALMRRAFELLEELQANRRTAELPGIQTLDGQLLRMVQTPQPGGEL